MERLSSHGIKMKYISIISPFATQRAKIKDALKQQANMEEIQITSPLHSQGKNTHHSLVFLKYHFQLPLENDGMAAILEIVSCVKTSHISSLRTKEERMERMETEKYNKKCLT